MEVDHDAMRQAGSATTPAPARPAETSNAMEHDPSAAPQIVDPSNPPMSFRSGAVPDHYESYPEVMPPQGLDPPSAYPQSAQSISPMQNPHYDQSKMYGQPEKSYYQPAYGISQPPPPNTYNNANTLVPDPNSAAPLYDKVGGAGATLPPPVAYSPPAGESEKKILGMKKKTFWIVLIVLIILVLAGIGGAVGGVLASKNKNSNSNSNSNSGNNNGSGSDRGNSTSGGGGGYTPFAITTGVRTLNLKYQQSQGSCNDPQHQDGGGVVNCAAESRYTVRVEGNVDDGYTLSSVNVEGSTFSNIPGTPPTTSDPNEVGSGWVFEVSFTQGGSCPTNRVTRYVFGIEDNIYAIGEAVSLQSQCRLTDGTLFSAGTACTCVAISTTA